MEEYFKDAEQSGFKDEKILQYGTKEKGLGCIEERLYYYSTDIIWMLKMIGQNLNCIGKW